MRVKLISSKRIFQKITCTVICCPDIETVLLGDPNFHYHHHHHYPHDNPQVADVAVWGRGLLRGDIPLPFNLLYFATFEVNSVFKVFSTFSYKYQQFLFSFDISLAPSKNILATLKRIATSPTPPL